MHLHLHGQARAVVSRRQLGRKCPDERVIFVSSDAPLNQWVFANTGLNVGDVIPGLIGVEYNGTLAGVGSPNGLQTLLHTQAPRFEAGLVTTGGGFPLPDNLNGTSMPGTNRWRHSSMGVAR